MDSMIPQRANTTWDIDKIITRSLDIPVNSLRKITDIVRSVEFPKGHLLFRGGKVEHDMYFLAKGIAHAYYYHEANKVTLCFNSEGDALISLKSYIQHQPGYEHIELLEPCKLYHLKTASLYELYNSDIHIANWGRKLAELELIKAEEQLMSKLFKTASERYQELIQKQPSLLQRVPLGTIASYLGISQVTLSRIRAEVR
ncbi:cyclic nucleotide-binding protein [Parapedobacter pyrenivorans]|uniref:Cyclic nucleotide-binding protein n=1 Tax=Parapedobacter pyrenivorans TaxID=1305674 RepID=A0A917HC28_9SPHI|nr:Crp/Fnr family transcriptional regulator [Parapedobacter pyrenivorans]GGG73745.1 cyclic nucleotide-binding protein [Parapedobacter pyrenivorans]